jgi:predicted MFS family arabinose efflux permease
MAGFFPLGLMLGMLGSLVITWHYHTDAEPNVIGLHFLGMSAGFVFASQMLSRPLSQMPVPTVGICSTGLGFVSLMALNFLSPPAAQVWRIAALTVAGCAAGGLTHSLFCANEAIFEQAPASAANRAGALFVGGALLATIVAGVTYFGGSPKTPTALLAIVPAVYLAVLFRNRFWLAREAVRHDGEDILRDTLRDLHSIAAMLFALLILFQFVCEWAIAGWLPLFLIHTLGINPATAIWALALYFLALMAGRLLAQFLLPIVSHRKMLLFGVALAMAGYLLLSLTSFTAIALAAAVVIGCGHAPIYPLVAERLHDRLSYHTGFYSGSISLAIAAAMATPWLLGYVAESFGMSWVMLIPAIASIVVLVLAILIMLESRLMGGRQNDTEQGLMASDI